MCIYLKEFSNQNTYKNKLQKRYVTKDVMFTKDNYVVKAVCNNIFMIILCLK